MLVLVVVAEDSSIKVVVVGDVVDSWHPFSWSNFPVSTCSKVTHWFTFFWQDFKIFTSCETCQSPLWLPQTRQIAPPFWSIKMIEAMSKGDDGDDDYDDAVRAKEERWPGWELLLSQIQWILQLGGFLGPVLSLQFVPRGHTAPKRSYIFLFNPPTFKVI